MFFAVFSAAALLTAGDCKNCGSKTDDCAVYRCNKCRTFFCANCREGEKTQKSGFREMDELNDLMFNMHATTNGIVVICPECGAKDKWTRSGMAGRNIRLIKE